MCNLYSCTTNLQAVRDFVRDIRRWEAVGNMPPQRGIHPDYLAPIVRISDVGRELVNVRWGMPTSSYAMFKKAQARAEKKLQRSLPDGSLQIVSRGQKQDPPKNE